MKEALQLPNNNNQANLGSAFVSYMGMMQSMYDGRPFLSAGGYVGLCPGDTQLGDIIFIPFGAHVPYIVRKLSKRTREYKLIGEAYVHGIMRGEFVNQTSSQPEIVIELK